MLGTQTFKSIVQQFWNDDVADPAQSLPAELDANDVAEYVEARDYVRVETSNPDIPFYGFVKLVRGDDVLVVNPRGGRGWAALDRVTLVWKATAVHPTEAGKTAAH